MLAVEIGDERLLERGPAGVEGRLFDEEEIARRRGEVEVLRQEVVEDDDVELRGERRA